MTDPGARTLRLLSLLQQRRYWAGADLADRLGVSVRTLRRDVDRLRELGYPVEAQRGVDGGYQLAPGAASPATGPARPSQPGAASRPAGGAGRWPGGASSASRGGPSAGSAAAPNGPRAPRSRRWSSTTRRRWP